MNLKQANFQLTKLVKNRDSLVGKEIVSEARKILNKTLQAVQEAENNERIKEAHKQLLSARAEFNDAIDEDREISDTAKKQLVIANEFLREEVMDS